MAVPCSLRERERERERVGGAAAMDRRQTVAYAVWRGVMLRVRVCSLRRRAYVLSAQLAPGWLGYLAYVGEPINQKHQSPKSI
jgi:hypothetical protein